MPWPRRSISHADNAQIPIDDVQFTSARFQLPGDNLRTPVDNIEILADNARLPADNAHLAADNDKLTVDSAVIQADSEHSPLGAWARYGGALIDCHHASPLFARAAFLISEQRLQDGRQRTLYERQSIVYHRAGACSIGQRVK